MKLKPGMLNGTKHTENVEYEFNGEIYEIEIRQLSHVDVAKIQTIQAGALVYRPGEAKPDVDMKEMVRSQFASQLLAAALGTTDPVWDEKTINSDWPSELIIKVGKRVMEISGIGTVEEKKEYDDEVSRFRENE